MLNKVNKTNKTHVVGLRVNPKTHSILEKIAAKEKRTISNLVGICIADWLERESKKKESF